MHNRFHTAAVQGSSHACQFILQSTFIRSLSKAATRGCLSRYRFPNR